MPALSLRARLRLVTRRLAAGLSPRTSRPVERPPRLHARRHPATSSPLPRMLLMAPSPSRQRLPVRKPPAALLSSVPTLPTKAQLRRPRLTAPPASTPPRARPRAPTATQARTPPRARPRAPPAPPARPTPLDLRFVAQSLLVTTALRVLLPAAFTPLMPALSLRARIRLVTPRLAAALTLVMPFSPHSTFAVSRVSFHSGRAASRCKSSAVPVRRRRAAATRSVTRRIGKPFPTSKPLMRTARRGLRSRIPA